MQNLDNQKYSGLRELLNIELMTNYNNSIVEDSIKNKAHINTIVDYGAGIGTLSKIFLEYSKDHLNELDNNKLSKYKNAPYRAPMIIILVCNIKEHPKVPVIEQKLSTAAAAQNILLSLHALKYGAIWRTGIFSLNKEINSYFNIADNEWILGYIYTGTINGKVKKLPKINIKDYVSNWS